MICEISEQLATNPVVTPQGHVFEKELLLKYLASNGGKCPVTGEEISEDSLIEIQSTKSSPNPRTINASTIPGIMQMLQTEWDSVMLESYTLKKHLDQVRQELAHSLYQQDAACRVIARLIRERDEARSALAQLQAQGANDMDVESTDKIPQAIKTQMTALSQQLSSKRKKRVIPNTLATPETLKSFTCVGSHSVHKAAPAGILCVDVHPDQDHIVTGGADKTAVIFSRKSSKKVATLSGHTKKVTSAVFHPTEDTIFTASLDKTAKVWSKSGSKYSAKTFLAHDGPVVGLDLHPTGNYLLTASSDAWAFHDISTLGRLVVANADLGIASMNIHPDGLLLATGASKGEVCIWDVQTQQIPATLKEHKKAVTAMAFSENGYFLATASEDKTLRLWDLRKQKCFLSINNDAVVKALEFDHSGSYLASAAGKVVSVMKAQTLEVVKTFEDHSKTVTDVCFGADAQFLVSTSLDRSLNVYGLEE